MMIVMMKFFRYGSIGSDGFILVLADLVSARKTEHQCETTQYFSCGREMKGFHLYCISVSIPDALVFSFSNGYSMEG